MKKSSKVKVKVRGKGKPTAKRVMRDLPALKAARVKGGARDIFAKIGDIKSESL